MRVPHASDPERDLMHTASMAVPRHAGKSQCQAKPDQCQTLASPAIRK
jgi:hypothetical protein